MSSEQLYVLVLVITFSLNFESIAKLFFFLLNFFKGEPEELYETPSDESGGGKEPNYLPGLVRG